jgi:hypothetical protein
MNFPKMLEIPNNNSPQVFFLKKKLLLSAILYLYFAVLHKIEFGK